MDRQALSACWPRRQAASPAWARPAPATISAKPVGRSGCVLAIEQGIEGAFRSAQLTLRRLACVCYGLTGKIEAMRPFLLEITPAEQVLLVGDTENAHIGALAGEPGLIVIADTGSVVFGINHRGESASAGGWGYLIGDEGSGYWIALRALGAITQAADGRGRPTRLTEGILHALEVDDLAALHAKMYYRTPSRPEIARLATVVGRLAAEGDAVAQEILATAGYELAKGVMAVLRRLGMLAEPTLVAPVGGVFRAGEWIGPLRAALQTQAPLVRIVAPRYPAVVGPCCWPGVL